jgi:hypothetical protein
MKYGTFVEAFGQLSRQIEFLSKALGHDDTRPMFQYILIEPSEKEEGKFRAISTDGRRLHIVEPLACPDNIGIELGAWRFLRSTSKSSWIAEAVLDDRPIFQPPNYGRVIPTGRPNFETDYNSDCANKGSGNWLVSTVRFINGFPDPTVINPDYLADLGNEAWKVSWFKNNKAVVFESGVYKAVIMPLNYME